MIHHRLKKHPPISVAVIYTILVTIVLLYAFFTKYNSLESIGILLVYLIPSFVLVAATIIAWRREFFGGVVFIFLSLFATIVFNTYRYISSILIVSIPLLLIGILFIIHSKKSDRGSVYKSLVTSNKLQAK